MNNNENKLSKYEEIAFHTQVYGSGIPVVMLHGFVLDHRVMKGSIEHLLVEKNFKRIYFDLPGMGLTKRSERVNHADEMIEAIVWHIKSLIGDSKFLLMGMSYGGYLARGVLDQLKDQVLGMFLFVPVVKPLSHLRRLPMHQVLKIETSFLESFSKEEQEAMMANNVVISAENYVREKAEILDAVEIADHEYLEKYQSEGYEASYDVDRDAALFEGPVTLLAGKQDSVVGYEDQYELSLKYKRSTFAAIDVAGHGLQIDQPELFNAFVNNWISIFETE